MMFFPLLETSPKWEALMASYESQILILSMRLQEEINEHTRNKIKTAHQ